MHGKYVLRYLGVPRQGGRYILKDIHNCIYGVSFNTRDFLPVDVKFI